MKYVFYLALFGSMLWLSPSNAQHLPSAPDFCGGNLCMESLPVESGGRLEYPTIYVTQDAKSRIISHQVRYKKIGYVQMSITLSEGGACDKNRQPMQGVIGRQKLTRYGQTFCGVMSGRTTYLLNISVHGVDPNSTRDLCMQALGSLWFFDPVGVYFGKAKMFEEKLPLKLNCPR